MRVRRELVDVVKEGVRKRVEGSDETFIHGAERVDITHVEHLKFEARKGRFRFLVDEPGERGGTDKAPNPLAYFLAGAGSCFMMQVTRLAIAEDVQLDQLRLTVLGRFDRRLGGAFLEIVYDIWVESGERAEKIAELIGRAEEMCYAHNTLKKAGLKLVTNVYLNGVRLREQVT